MMDDRRPGDVVTNNIVNTILDDWFVGKQMRAAREMQRFEISEPNPDIHRSPLSKLRQSLMLGTNKCSSKRTAEESGQVLE
jgi:hypothetical protein